MKPVAVNFFLLSCMVLFFWSCSVIYKKSSLYKENTERINDLEVELKNLSGIEEKYEHCESLLNSSTKKLSTDIKNQTTAATSILKEFSAQQVKYKNVTYDLLIISDTKDIGFFWKENKSNKIINSLSNLVEYIEKSDKELLFAMNAGMFEVNQRPVGLYIEDGQELSPVNTDKNKKGNFYLFPNGIFLIEKDGTAKIIETEGYNKYEGIIRYATQSGPMLVINGKIHEKFKEDSPNLQIRNGVGINSKSIVFAISRQPVNFYAFAEMLKNEFKCENALYLDGTISEMYFPLLGKYESNNQLGPLIGIVKNKQRK